MKEIKYFVVILNCTWDTNHQDQMTFTLKYVDISKSRWIFLEFLKVDDAYTKWLS